MTSFDEETEDIIQGIESRVLSSLCDTTLALTVAYDGAPFCGFAKQPGQLTVQGELEHALELLFRREVPTTCAGRTDSGVHAIGQVVSFDIASSSLEGRTNSSLLRSLNALTHDRIVVKEVREMPLGFSARFDALARKYRYFLNVSELDSIFLDGFSWRVGPLDLEAMQEGADHLLGEHDFKSFCIAKSAVDKPTCRNISSITIRPETILEGSFAVVEVVGNAFLHSMVRTIVGTLVAVGKGRRSPEWVKEVLEACDRKAAGECAPARGLVFWEVLY